MFPTLTLQILQKLNFCNVITQYILVGTWVKVGNILLFEKNNVASPFSLFTIRSINCISHA